MSSWKDSLGGLDAHHRFFWAAGAAAAAGLAGMRFLPPLITWVTVWNVFSLTVVVLCWLKMVFADARTSVREAKLQDFGRRVIMVVVIAACVTALISAGLLLSTTKGAGEGRKGAAALFALATVLISWLTIHTIFALHYTHLFYRGEKGPKSPKDHGGLSFPDDLHPGYLDFAYFSFVIGMTAQVSDVEITSKTIRRLALWHGMLSFAFNTVILALTINLASSLVSS